jgi:hypothetical protein
MSYNQKKGQESNWDFDSQPQIPFKQKPNDFRLGHVIHHWKKKFKHYKILPLHAPNTLFLRKIECPKFWDIKNPNLGSLGKKCHLDVAPTESHIIYYRDGSGASSQGLWVV